MPCLEGLLDAPVLAGMEGQDRHPATGFQAHGQQGEELIQHRKLIIHRDAKGLEGSLEHPPQLLQSFCVGKQPLQCLSNAVRQLCGRGDGLPMNGAGYDFRVGFIGVLLQQVRQILFADRLQQG